MARKPVDVTDAELSILQLLWGNGEATVRDLTLSLYPRQTPSDLATVQKLLKRLEEKHCVERDRSQWPHLFRSSINRNELIGRRLQDTADDLCNGALTPLLTHLVKISPLTAADRRELRDLLDSLDARNSSGNHSVSE
jgi:predicted transcriptional regulator